MNYSFKFPWLKYPVSKVKERIENYPFFDCFIFVVSINADGSNGFPFGLLSYSHGNTMGSTEQYNETYYDPSGPYNLIPYNNCGEVLSGNIILAPNAVSKEDIENLLAANESNVNTLLFKPFISKEGILYFKVSAGLEQDGKIESFPLSGGGFDLNTNPSPPATIQGVIQ